MLSIAGGLGLGGASVQAAIVTGDVIRVDFGTTDPGGNYNLIDSATLSIGDLKRFSDGENVGVGLAVTASNPFDNAGNVASTAGLPNIETADADVFEDGFLSANGNNGAGTDTITLTFTGLDDGLHYDLSGGLARNPANANFQTTWAIAGEVDQISDASAANGYVHFTDLTSSGGTLVVTLTDDVRQCGLAQLALVATEVIPPTSQPIALGDTIYIDFGGNVATGNYNQVSSAAKSISNTIRLADGVATDVGFSVDAVGSAAESTANSGILDLTGHSAGNALDGSDANLFADAICANDAGGSNAGDDIITLTFTGLDDSLYYDVTGGFATTPSKEINFQTVWTAGSEVRTSTASTSAGYILFESLASSSGDLVITLTDNGYNHTAVSQLALVATDTPPPPPILPPAPELPADDVVVFFDPTEADASATVEDLDYMTIGGTWNATLASTSQFVADASTGGYPYAMGGSSSQGDYLELVLDGGGLDFSAADVAINFQMLATRASSGGDQHATLIGYDGSDEIFRLKYVAHTTNTNNAITTTTVDGDESMGFTPLIAVPETAIPSGLQDFRIVLSGNQVFFSGSSLTPQDGPVMNSSQQLTCLRWEITGTSSSNQGFWLDDLQIRDGMSASPRPATDRPNVIFMLMDDMGYSDLSCYGATSVSTPNIDSLAGNGLQFTNFVLPGNVCSPTRAAFLTGAYPSRCGIPMAVNHPNENHWFLGLDPDEITIAEQCRSRGYKTFMVGKWHLGVDEVFLPHNQGFDHFFGTWGNGGSVYDETEVAFSSFPQNRLTSMYTQRIREHIRESRDRPFFIYYPHNYPHTPYTEGNAFNGSTGNGTRSDVIKELDWSIGQIVAELEANGILENTLIVFTSDNGAVPPASYANAPFRGSKYVTWEGGHRVPFIMHWKNQVQTPAVLDSPQVWAMDVFPTVSELVGEPMDTNRVYDGTSLVPVLSDQPIARAADAPFFYYNGDNLQCVRKGDWKLHLPRTEYQLPWWDQIKPPPSVYRLYDLSSDPGESRDLLTDPEIIEGVPVDYTALVAELTALAAAIRLELGDSDPTDGSLVMGSGQRGTGTLFPEVPTILNNESDYGYVPDWNSLTDEEKGRGKTLFQVDGISSGGAFINGQTLPTGWQYLNSDEASGGVEVAMSAGASVGTEGNTGFSGVGTAGLIGDADVGAFVIDTGNGGNGGVEGTDLLISTDDDPSRDFVIVRYTVSEADISFGKTRASISGSFRDLVGGTTDDSVEVHVFHNTTEIFTATGSAGRLLEAAGTFALSDVVVAANDTISFVIGSRGASAGDEVALKTSIQFELEPSPGENFALGIKPGPVASSGLSTLQLRGTPGQSYVVEWSFDLGEEDAWQVIDEIPFLPNSPHDVHVESTEERGFWRVGWEAR